MVARPTRRNPLTMLYNEYDELLTRSLRAAGKSILPSACPRKAEEHALRSPNARRRLFHLLWRRNEWRRCWRSRCRGCGKPDSSAVVVGERGRGGRHVRPLLVNLEPVATAEAKSLLHRQSDGKHLSKKLTKTCRRPSVRRSVYLFLFVRRQIAQTQNAKIHHKRTRALFARASARNVPSRRSLARACVPRPPVHRRLKKVRERRRAELRRDRHK